MGRDREKHHGDVYHHDYPQEHRQSGNRGQSFRGHRHQNSRDEHQTRRSPSMSSSRDYTDHHVSTLHGPPLHQMQSSMTQQPAFLPPLILSEPNSQYFQPPIMIQDNFLYSPMGPAPMMQPMYPNPSHYVPFRPPIDFEQAISSDALNRLQLPSNQITETGIIPATSYYELPAGLMVPLVSTDRLGYKPLQPADLRLPLPKFPDEEFMGMIDRYYKQNDTTRDNDGWDREFIDRFLADKKSATRDSVPVATN